jgi:plastocyanin
MKDDKTMRLVMKIGAAAILLSVGGCSKSTTSNAAATSEPAPATTAAPAAQVGSVSGTAAPNVIIVLAPKTPRDLPASEPVWMDQVSATFTPEFLFVRTGQPVEFRNSDDTLHNVHVGNADTGEPSFNVAIPTGEHYAYTFAKDGFYHVGCDIHPAMSAEIFAASTPFVARTASDGSFSFTDVPTGPYVLRSLLGGEKKEREVEVKAGANSLPPVS